MGRIDMGDLEEVEKRVYEMQDILDAVEETGVWPRGERSARRQLCMDLCYFALYLAYADKGMDRQRLNYINRVFHYNLTFDDVENAVALAEEENDGEDFCSILLEGYPDVIIDACDAEDELCARGMALEVSLPAMISDLFGFAGKIFISDPSKKELAACGLFMMNINSMLTREGYFDFD